MTTVVAGLTTANVIGAATGFISGPLLARALGSSGRGDLAAIQVTLSLVPGIVGLGIPGYAFRELPRGRPVEEVMGSLGLPLIVLGLITGAVAVPIADALAGGRETVRLFLIIELLSMPLLLLASLFAFGLSAVQRWRARIVTTLVPFLVPFLVIVVAYLAGHLTVAIAAAGTIGGALLALVPGLPLLRRRPVFRLSIARQGVSFGLKSWVGGLALIANARLDQFLMITVVAPRVLGLYAVATTISGASGLATGALMPPLMTRVAAGERQLLPQAVRMTIIATGGIGVVLAAITPTLLSVLFGPQFTGATAMALILLAASVPLFAAGVLSSGLQADGAPLIPSAAEAVALVITAVGLAVLLKPLGGVGAAIVSLAAYSTSFVVQVVMAHRRLGVPLTDFLVPCRADAEWARSVFGGLIAWIKAR